MGRASLGRYRAIIIGGCALAAVAAGAVIWGVTRPRVPDPQSLRLPAAVFVAQDGTTYTRVAVAYLDTSKSSGVEVNVPPGRTPLSVFPACALARPRSDDLSGVLVGRPDTAYWSSFGCRSRNAFGLEVVDLDRSALTAGGRLRFTRADTLADAPATAPAAWAFAVYSWTLPARLTVAPAAPQAATTLTTEGGHRLTLVHEYHGTWPVQRTVRISVPSGRGFIVAFTCTSAIADKTISFVRADQQLVDMGSVTCNGPGKIELNSYAHLYIDQPTTVSITLNFDPIFDRRGGSWTVAIYGP